MFYVDRVRARGAFRIGIAGRLQPVTRPVFAVARRGEKPFDEAVVRVGPRIVHDVVNVFRVGRHAGDVEVRTADESPAIGVTRKGQTARLEPLEQEGIDRRSHPLMVLHVGQRRSARLPKGPPFTIFLADEESVILAQILWQCGLLHRSSINPFLDDR